MEFQLTPEQEAEAKFRGQLFLLVVRIHQLHGVLLHESPLWGTLNFREMFERMDEWQVYDKVVELIVLYNKIKEV